MADYGSTAAVLSMLRPNETASYGADITARLAAIQKAVSRRLEWELRGSLGAVAGDTTRTVYAGPSPTLILPVPARTITSVTVGGLVSGSTVTGGTLYPASTLAYDPIDEQGRILGIRLQSGTLWGYADADGTPLTPVVIVGDFTDTDLVTVPDDVTYAANLAIMRTFQAEQTGVGGVSGPDGTFQPVRDPFKDPFIKGVIERYRVQRVPGF